MRMGEIMGHRGRHLLLSVIIRDRAERSMQNACIETNPICESLDVP
jgi:hypothetical protein